MNWDMLNTIKPQISLRFRSLKHTKLDQTDCMCNPLLCSNGSLSAHSIVNVAALSTFLTAGTTIPFPHKLSCKKAFSLKDPDSQNSSDLAIANAKYYQLCSKLNMVEKSTQVRICMNVKVETERKNQNTVDWEDGCSAVFGLLEFNWLVC